MNEEQENICKARFLNSLIKNILHLFQINDDKVSEGLLKKLIDKIIEGSKCNGTCASCPNNKKE